MNKIRILEEKEKDSNYAIEYALIYLVIGDTNKVFEYLEKAFEEKIGVLIFIRSRHWKDIHDDERFKSLLQKMKLPLD